MPTSYTSILKLALPATGELSGTWGDVVNNNITSMVEQAIAGLATINTWVANAHTLTTANGTTSESRCAILVFDDDGSGNPSAPATVTCPTATKIYIAKNISGQPVTLKTAAGTGVTIPNNSTATVFCDGVNVVESVTYSGSVNIDGGTIDNTVIGGTTPAAGTFTTLGATTGNITTGNITTVNATTVDTTNIEVTNIKAKDGTAAGSIADSTGVVTFGSTILTTTDINGGTIDGTAIGGSTPAAGAFTTLTTSSNVTLSGGTANGVAYLNASKVLTTGSALTFDGANFGIGTNSPSSYLAGVPGLAIRGHFAGISLSESTSNTYWLNYNDQGNLLWYRNAVGEVMRLTSTGLGIGTSSPTNKLTVAGGIDFSASGFSGSGTGIWSPTTNELGFVTAGSTRLRIDASGNVGIGTATPVTYSGYTSVNIKGTNGGVLGFTSGSTYVGEIASTGAAFSIGTLPNYPLVFNVNSAEQMRLTSTGLGIGTSSPGAKLDVNGTAAISGNVTLSGGTANGVAYLDGSKVLTTGSALTFDGSTLGLISAGLNTQNSTSDTVNPITVSTNQIRMGASGFVSFRLGTAYDFNIDSYNAASPINLYNVTQAGTHKWSVLGSEQMRLTSTGLGIGTSSPVSKLQSLSAVSALTSNNGFSSLPLTVSDSTALAADTGGGINFSAIITAAGAYNSIAAIRAGRTAATTFDYRGYLSFYTSNNSTGYPIEQMRLDSSGNLGLGVTPSAWTTFKVIDLANVGAIAAYPNYSIGIYRNAYYDGAYKYKISGSGASWYDQDIDGSHRFYTAPSGTAGNAISFTQAMTLTAAGNLGVGTSSPLTRLNVSATASTIGQVRIDGTGVGALFAGMTAGSIGFLHSNTGTLAFGTSSSDNNLVERMRIDSSGNVGIGTTGLSNGKLTVLAGTSASGNSLFLQNSDGTYNPYLQVQHSSAGVKLYASSSAGGNASALTLSSAGVDAMTVLGGNVGIGTSSPAARLHVRLSSSGSTPSGSAVAVLESLGANLLDFVGTDGTSSVQGLSFTDGTVSRGRIWYTHSNDSLAFSTLSTERLRIDSSGNLGLGVTPSAWGTLTPAMQIGTGGAFLSAQSSNPAFYSGANAYFDSANWRYQVNAGAVYYRQNGSDSSHAWYNAPSGTAGNPITFTQAMTLDASGNLGVGTTSPGAKLDVVGQARVLGGGANSDAELLLRSSGSAVYQKIQFYNSAGTSYSAITGYAGSTLFIDAEALYYRASGASGTHVFETNSTERMRINSSGNVGIGTASPTTPLEIVSSSTHTSLRLSSTAVGNTGGQVIFAGAAAADMGWIKCNYPGEMIFGSYNGSSVVERMRIDSSGNVLISKSAESQGTAGVQIRGDAPGLIEATRADNVLTLRRNSTDGDIATFRRDATTVGTISVTTTATSYNTSSDYRLKNVDGELTNSGSYIDSLRPVHGTWKADGSKFIGLIAHEVQDVSQTKVATGEKDGDEMQTMDYSSPEIIANLIAEIQSLRKRVAQLENL